MSDRQYDLVVFGATGFTGGLVCNYLARTAEPMRWALAGRNRDKLERVRAGLSGPGAQAEIVIADVNDAESLRALAAQTRVVLSTVGPYIVYGEGLVAACADAGTDYVDITGEPEFLALTRERYRARAEANRARIIHACGFDSAPHDLGAYLAVKALRRRMTVGEQDTLPVSVEGVMRFDADVSGGTWHSIVTLLSRARGAPVMPVPTAPAGRKLTWLPQRLKYRDGLWLVPLPSIDPLIVLLSARTLDEYGPDFRYGHYLGLRYLVQVLGLAAGYGLVYGLAQLERTRRWLLALRTPGDGPSEARRAKGWFRAEFYASAGERRASAVVSGGEPFYTETAKMVAEAALCLVHDRARLPERHGVITTASAFGDRLIERLQRAGICFETSDGPLSAPAQVERVTRSPAHP